MNSYISQYGNVSHILNIIINPGLTETEKTELLSSVYELINNKDIVKTISQTSIPIKWKVSNKSDLMHYYTDVNGLLGDRAVYEHTQLLVKDILASLNTDNVKIIVTKPLTKKTCIL